MQMMLWLITAATGLNGGPTLGLLPRTPIAHRRHPVVRLATPSEAERKLKEQLEESEALLKKLKENANEENNVFVGAGIALASAVVFGLGGRSDDPMPDVVLPPDMAGVAPGAAPNDLHSRHAALAGQPSARGARSG